MSEKLRAAMEETSAAKIIELFEIFVLFRILYFPAPYVRVDQ